MVSRYVPQDSQINQILQSICEGSKCHICQNVSQHGVRQLSITRHFSRNEKLKLGCTEDMYWTGASHCTSTLTNV